MTPGDGAPESPFEERGDIVGREEAEAANGSEEVSERGEVEVELLTVGGVAPEGRTGSDDPVSSEAAVAAAATLKVKEERLEDV